MARAEWHASALIASPFAAPIRSPAVAPDMLIGNAGPPLLNARDGNGGDRVIGPCTMTQSRRLPLVCGEV